MPRAEDLMRSLLPRLRRDLFNDTRFFHPLVTPLMIRMRLAAKPQRRGAKPR